MYMTSSSLPFCFVLKTRFWLNINRVQASGC